MEEWHIPGKAASKRVHYRLQTRTVERLSARHQAVLATFLGFKKPLYSCTEGMYHSSTRPGTSYHVTQFYQAFPRAEALVLQATNAGARRSGYEAKHETDNTLAHLCLCSLLLPPFFKILLQLHPGLFKEVLDVLNLSFQVTQLAIQLLETVGDVIES